MHDFRHQAAGTMPGAARDDDPDIRILRRVSGPDTFPFVTDPVGEVRSIAIVDTETTGIDPHLDEIIDVAVIIVEADELGQIVRVERVGEALRDRGCRSRRSSPG